MLNGMLLTWRRFYINRQTACIAIPSLSGCALEWKTPSQCVWDDAEFSQNGLELNSKTAIRRTVEQFAPMAKAFFTDVLKLRNANIKELLTDLILTQKNKPNDTDTVYRLYERIETHRRSSRKAIMHVFTSKTPCLADFVIEKLLRSTPSSLFVVSTPKAASGYH